MKLLNVFLPLPSQVRSLVVAMLRCLQIGQCTFWNGNNLEWPWDVVLP